MNLLRNLARACQAFVKAAILERSRSTVAITEASIAQERRTPKMGEQACWIIISGIVGIWGQRDLWMDVEDALASIG
jgi:membrane-bound lytic murein transglycosylase B